MPANLNAAVSFNGTLMAPSNLFLPKLPSSKFAVFSDSFNEGSLVEIDTVPPKVFRPNKVP